MDVVAAFAIASVAIPVAFCIAGVLAERRGADTKRFFSFPNRFDGD